MYSHVITKFSRMGRYLDFATHGAPLAHFARESSAMMEFLRYFLRPSFWGKPVVVSRNFGCFLKLT